MTNEAKDLIDKIKQAAAMVESSYELGTTCDMCGEQWQFGIGASTGKKLLFCLGCAMTLHHALGERLKGDTRMRLIVVDHRDEPGTPPEKETLN